MKKERVWEQTGLPHIYMVANLVNGKKYIGMHSGGNPKYVCSGTKVKQALRNEGVLNFSRIILETSSEGVQKLEGRESHYIALYETQSPEGYNICPKGHGRRPEGFIPWNKGGGEYSEGSRTKMRNSKLGTTLPNEHKSKISATMLGKPKSDAHRKNISIGKGKPVLQWDLEGNFIAEHYSSIEGAKAVGCKRESIRDACTGKMKTCKGFKWTFKDLN